MQVEAHRKPFKQFPYRSSLTQPFRKLHSAVVNPRGSIYTTYGIRPQKNHPYFGFWDLIP